MAFAMTMLPVIASELGAPFEGEDISGLKMVLVKWLEVLSVIQVPQQLAVGFMMQLIEELLGQKDEESGLDGI